MNSTFKPRLSLKARALKYLAARDHSRVELERKFADKGDDPDEIKAVLDECEARGWLSQERFAQSLTRRRQSNYGGARVLAELKTHQVSAEVLSHAKDELKQTEFARAHLAWQKKFGALAEDATGRAKQARFLAQRGFATEVIFKIVKGVEEEG